MEKLREAQELSAEDEIEALPEKDTAAKKSSAPAPAAKVQKAPVYGQEAKLQKLELKIAELEATLKMYEVKMNMPENQTDAEAMMSLTADYEAAQAKLDAAYEEWESLAES